MGRAYHKSTFIGTDNPSSQHTAGASTLQPGAVRASAAFQEADAIVSGEMRSYARKLPQGFICERTDPALIDMTKQFDIEIVPPFAPPLPNDNETGLL